MTAAAWMTPLGADRSLRPSPGGPDRLERLLLLRARVDGEIAAERIHREQLLDRRLEELDHAKVRAWARAHGEPVRDRGRIPRPIAMAYLDAHPEPA